MEQITSRKNQHIQHFRALASDTGYRRKAGLFVCEGEKLLREALWIGAEIDEILLRGDKDCPRELPDVPVYRVPAELFRYVSSLENSPGPLFSVKIKNDAPDFLPERVIMLENVQDPGNVGTVLRSAAALNVSLVILCGDCADAYHPKTVRGAMGALFHQRLWQTDVQTAVGFCRKSGLPVYGAVLRKGAADLRSLDLRHSAVAVGNEGAGLSEELLSLCSGQLIIPMRPGSESLNAAVSASLIMWEMTRG